MHPFQWPELCTLGNDCTRDVYNSEAVLGIWEILITMVGIVGIAETLIFGYVQINDINCYFFERIMQGLIRRKMEPFIHVYDDELMMKYI